MIKKVNLIKKIKGKYPIDLDIFEFSPNISDKYDRNSKYLTGAYYCLDYPMVALFISDEDGIIIDNKPFIQEEGIRNYQELFKMFGYTLI